MRLRNLKSAIGTLALAAALASGANLASFSGHILGEVRNSAGVTQMGATVALYNRYDQEIRQVLSNRSRQDSSSMLCPRISTPSA